MIHLITYFTIIAILASYSAALTSFLAVKIVFLPFTTMQGLVEDNTYKIGVLKGSADHVLLKVHPELAYLFNDISESMNEGLKFETLLFK